eukprot:COSAG06_NODE_4214_length_4468_cov_10.307780_7_plen_51_part_00
MGSPFYYPDRVRITEWMKLSDPTRKTYYVNASTHQVQRDAPTTGEVEHIA